MALINYITQVQLDFGALALLPPNLFGKPVHDVKMPGVPGHARQLPRSIGNARRQT